MIYNDFRCLKCEKVFEDVQHEAGTGFQCTDCGTECTIMFSRMSFKEGFKDSHKQLYKSNKKK